MLSSENPCYCYGIYRYDIGNQLTNTRDYEILIQNENVVRLATWAGTGVQFLKPLFTKVV